MCGTHYQRWRRNGDPLASTIRRGPEHYAWTGDDATYAAVHQRLYSLHGLARLRACRLCEKPAVQWAYTYGAPDERVGDDGHGRSMPYSTDLTYYVALCNPCHRRLDLRHLPVIQGAA